MDDGDLYYLSVAGVVGPDVKFSGYQDKSNHHHGITVDDFSFVTSHEPGNAADVGPLTVTVDGTADLLVFTQALNSGKPLSGVSLWGQSNLEHDQYADYDNYLLNLDKVAVTGITQNTNDGKLSYTVSLKPLQDATLSTRPEDGSDPTWASTTYDVASGKTGAGTVSGIDGRAGTIDGAEQRYIGLRIGDSAFAGLGDHNEYDGKPHHDLIGVLPRSRDQPKRQIPIRTL